MAGYSFYVMNNAFLSHWGYAAQGSTPEWRAIERKSNELLLEGFVKDPSARYHQDPFGMLKKFSDKKLNITKIISMFAGKSPEAQKIKL